MGILIRNVHLLESAEHERTDLYITGDHISGIGKEPRGFSLDEVIDGSGKTAMPGLINCHTHAYMSLMRNYADDLPFEEWLFSRITPVEDSLTAEDAYWGNMLSIMEMIRTGTTTFVDMQMFPKMAVKACADSGMRALITRGLVGSSREDEGGLRRLREAFDEMSYGEASGAKVEFGLGPHAIYTCGEDYLRYVTGIAHDRGLKLNIHLAETEKEFKDCLARYGCTPVEYLDRLGMFEGHILLAHCVYLSDHDFELLARPNIYVVTNPASNMKLANGFAPVQRMLDAGIRVALGTDSAASNNSLNMFREMNLLTLAQKGADRSALSVSAGDAVAIAVKNGADAVGRPDLGGIRAGSTADLILLDDHMPNFMPVFNRKAALAYSATGYEVSDVLIGGQVVMRNRNLTTIDEEQVYYEVRKIAERFS